MNAHNFILCMNSKDLSEEVRDASKYTGLCNYSIKNLCDAVLQIREFLFGNQIPALKTNSPQHKELSNALYKEGLIEDPHAKLSALTPNFLQIIPDRRSSVCSCSITESFFKAIFTKLTD